MERLKRFWNAFRDVAIIFSFAVNFVLIISLLVVSIPATRAIFDLKAGLLEPLLSDLDAAFVGLNETTIDTTVEIEESIPIQFVMPLDQSMPINFELAIEQDMDVMLNEPVPLNLPAKFTLPGGGGVINGFVSLSLPDGMSLPVHLDMIVPVSQTIPVRMDVPVSQTIPIQMVVPVSIKLGEAGMEPAVEKLRAVLRPVTSLVDTLPDGIELGSE